VHAWTQETKGKGRKEHEEGHELEIRQTGPDGTCLAYQVTAEYGSFGWQVALTCGTE
jgi:hypothetical protein